MARMRLVKRWVNLVVLTVAMIGVMAWLLEYDHSPSMARAQFVPRQMIEGPYWTVQSGFESSLMVSNTSNEPIQVFPDIFDADGQQVELPMLALREHERRQLDVRDWLSQQKVTVTCGSLRFRHTGKEFALAAQVTITQPDESWSFDFPVDAREPFYRSSRLDGVWWLPTTDSEATLILTSASDRPLTVRPTLLMSGQPRALLPVTLHSHQMRELSLRDMLAAANLTNPSLTDGGLRLEHDGEPGDVLAYVMVHNDRGFSTTIRCVDPAMRQSRSLHGAGVLLKQTAVSGVGATSFETVLLVGNTSGVEQDAQVKVTYTVGLLTKTATLPGLRLGAYEVKRLTLNEALGQAHLPRQIDSAGLEVAYSSEPGSIVAHAVSFDRSTNMAFDVLIKDPDALPGHRFAFPWRLDGPTRSLVQIKNTRQTVGEFRLTLVHEAGEWDWGVQPIPPGETVTLDIRALRDRQIASDQDQVIPRWIERGQAQWTDLSPHRGLIGRVAIYDPRIKINTSANETGPPPTDSDTTGCISFDAGPCVGDFPDPDWLVQTAALRTLTVGTPRIEHVFNKVYNCETGEYVYGSNISAHTALNLTSDNQLIAEATVNTQLKQIIITPYRAGPCTITATWSTTVYYPNCDPAVTKTFTARLPVNVVATAQITNTAVTPTTIAPAESSTLTVRVHHSAGLSGTALTVQVAQLSASSGCVSATPATAQTTQTINTAQAGDVTFNVPLTAGASSCNGSVFYRATLLPVTQVTIQPPAGGADQTMLAIQRRLQVISHVFSPDSVTLGQTTQFQVVVQHSAGFLNTPVKLQLAPLNPPSCLQSTTDPPAQTQTITTNQSGTLNFTFQVTIGMDSCGGTFQWRLLVSIESDQPTGPDDPPGGDGDVITPVIDQPLPIRQVMINSVMFLPDQISPAPPDGDPVQANLEVRVSWTNTLAGTRIAFAVNRGDQFDCIWTEFPADFQNVFDIPAATQNTPGGTAPPFDQPGFQIPIDVWQNDCGQMVTLKFQVGIVPLSGDVAAPGGSVDAFLTVFPPGGEAYISQVEFIPPTVEPGGSPSTLRVTVSHSASMQAQLVGVEIQRTDSNACITTDPQSGVPRQQIRSIGTNSSGTVTADFPVQALTNNCSSQQQVTFRASLFAPPGNNFTTPPDAPPPPEATLQVAAPPPPNVQVQINQITDGSETFSVDPTPAQVIRVWNDPITVRATFNAPTGITVSAAKFLVNQHCEGTPLTYTATISGTSFSANIRAPICLSAFGNISLEARLEYTDNQSRSLVASDTITISVVPIRVMIDPGHGGSDPGASGPSTGPDGRPVTPLKEKDLALDIGLRLRDRLDFIGPAPPILVLMTRATDVYPPIPQRADLSEQQFVDVFVSIHFNIGSPSVNGTETYYRTNGPAQPSGVRQRSIDYAALLAQVIDSVAVGGGNRGARPSSASPLGRLGVLDDNDRPAALVETSFLSNPSEQERLRSPGYRDIIAQAYEIAITQGDNLRPRFRDQRNPRY